MATKRKTSGRRGAHRAIQRPDRAASERPVVAIVGRPNVGKSALFNKLTGSRLSIVEDIPGVTRDRIYADAMAFGRSYILIDTGGFDPGSDDPMTQGIATQVKVALAEADLVLCVFDGTREPLPSDTEAIRLLREAELPVLYLANKIDNPSVIMQASDLYRLGVPELLPVSALHGHGVGDLEEQIAALLPEQAPDPYETEHASTCRIAIVGRPNAGKSSLVNRLLGEDRQLVDNRPGTTVDSVDTMVEHDGEPVVLIDTAGIRRKRSIERGVEGLSVLQAMKAIERSDAVVLLIDADRGPAEQDTKIASLALQRGRAIVIALNKTDLLRGDGRKEAGQKTRDVLSFLPWAPVCYVSAKSGRGVSNLVATAKRCAENNRARVTTGQLNRFFEEVLEHHPPPTSGGRSIRIYFVTQATTAPPTFVAVSNFPDRVHFSYKRYVINQLRQRFGFEGCPVRVFYRPKKKA